MNIWRQLFISPRCYLALGVVILTFLLGMFSTTVYVIALVLLAGWVAALMVDGFWLFGQGGVLEASRTLRQRLSNGDPNPVQLRVESGYVRPVHIRLIDELPPQFQRRDLDWQFRLEPGSGHEVTYTVRPVERGAYQFGDIHCFVRTSVGLLKRRHTIQAAQAITVYPSYLQLRHYGFLAFDKRLQDAGLKKIRRVGHTMEFEQIREYVQGDDTRVLNWTAPARVARPMVNQFQEERAQPVYCVLDKGRLMEMPFDEMTLLDHAINTALVMSYIAIHKQDKAGMVTFAERIHDVVRAGRRSHQMQRILEVLYRQETDFLEADFERLAAGLRRHVRQRSLLLLMTNFESVVGLRRQLPYLQVLARQHVVVVIFFQNTALRQLTDRRARSLREIYHQTLAERAQYEKQLMVRLLRSHGMHAVLTDPAELTPNTINAYLALKARGII
ncbi:MAG: DUF58 domain-containing protein [Saprospiraceae bacterium]|nr:DUF58 domain-containing protein [Saprospiraceae bacterium]